MKLRRKSLEQAITLYAFIGAFFQILLIYFLFYSPHTFLGFPLTIWVIIMFGIFSLINGVALYIMFTHAEG
jgi:hypothetical protein